MDIERIINIIREEMMNTDPDKTGYTGFSSKAKDPVSGLDPIMDLRRKYGKKLNLFYRKRLQDIKNVRKSGSKK
jgi:hypothetical protein